MGKLPAPAAAIPAITTVAATTAAASATTARTATAASGSATTATTAVTATTAAATAAASGPATTATTAFAGRTRFVHDDVSAIEIVAIQSLHGAVGFFVVVNLNEPEPARLTRETVAHQRDICRGDSRLRE